MKKPPWRPGPPQPCPHGATSPGGQEPSREPCWLTPPVWLTCPRGGRRTQDPVPVWDAPACPPFSQSWGGVRPVKTARPEAWLGKLGRILGSPLSPTPGTGDRPFPAFDFSAFFWLRLPATKQGDLSGPLPPAPPSWPGLLLPGQSCPPLRGTPIFDSEQKQVWGPLLPVVTGQDGGLEV